MFDKILYQQTNTSAAVVIQLLNTAAVEIDGSSKFTSTKPTSSCFFSSTSSLLCFSLFSFSMFGHEILCAVFALEVCSCSNEIEMMILFFNCLILSNIKLKLFLNY